MSSSATRPKRSRHSSHRSVLVSLFAWGGNSDGQLGIGAATEAATVPARLPDDCSGVSSSSSSGGGVRALCGGNQHSVLLREDGCVLTCGGNEFGQLGRGGVVGSGGGGSCSRFSQVTPLESKRAVCIAAGGWHSLAVDEDGQVFAWGRNHRGQLGRRPDDNQDGGVGVRLVRQLSSGRHQAAHVAAGQVHSVVLTRQHCVFACGDNSRGQLGQGHFNNDSNSGSSNSSSSSSSNSDSLKPVASLAGLPVSRVACGGYHSLVLSHSGVLFGWGGNTKGQLGCGNTQDQAWPVQCRNLRGQQIRHVSCGQEHSAALTADGGVFTFGAGLSGQLGHGQLANEVLPRRVADLMGSSVTQLACGRMHTLAYVPSTGRVYGFGLAASGQLGIGDKLDAGALTQPRSTACVVKGPWVPASGSGQFLVRQISVEGLQERHTPLVLFACGDASFLKAAATAMATPPPPADDLRRGRPSWLAASAAPLRLDDCLATPRHQLGLAAASLACYNCAFLLVMAQDDQQQQQQAAPAAPPSRQYHGVDMDAAAARLEQLGKDISKEAEDQLLAGLLGVLSELCSRTNYADIECLRFFLLAPLFHLFSRLHLYDHLHSDYAQALTRLDPVPTKVVCHWLGQLPMRHFARMVRTFKATASHVLKLPAHANRTEALAKERGLDCCMRLLRLLHDVNNGDRGDASALPCSSFYMPEINTRVDIERDYAIWTHQRGQTSHFSFCDFPFVFDGTAKTTLLRADARLKMQQAVQQAQTQNFLSAMALHQGEMVNPLLLLQVRRDNVVGDAISHLSKYPPEELRKPLRVKFVGEDAEDEGGVSKEFFQLIFREILNPLYGMFRSYDSRLIWFNFGSLEDASLFHLIGILCGLAIYNSYLAGVAFPLALYKKLLGRRPGLDDLKELDPVVGKNLQLLLEMESAESVEALALTFEIEVDFYGELRRFPLGGAEATTTADSKLPAPASSASSSSAAAASSPAAAAAASSSEEPVTLDSRQRYVDAYVDFVFTVGCRESYAAFHDGFHKVCGGPVLRMFEPTELQTMLVGEADNFHWDELQKNAQYLGVYYAGHEVIANFWSVFHRDLTESQKRKFLHFLTGCDRVPIQGMSAVQIRIQPVHGGAKYLPVAHTCYNLLDLPLYPDRDSLKAKLVQAIEQTEGFALV